MTTDVMILANGVRNLVAFMVIGFVVMPWVMNAILGGENKAKPRHDPHDSIGTKLRRFRDCRTVRCERADCQTWNPQRARFCRHCGVMLR